MKDKNTQLFRQSGSLAEAAKSLLKSMGSRFGLISVNNTSTSY